MSPYTGRPASGKRVKNPPGPCWRGSAGEHR